MYPAGLVAGSGWAAGLNLWAVTAALGIAGRAGWADTPSFTQNVAVIVVAIAMYLVEFVVDKIPYVDSAWDVINTAVRPLGAAVLALSMSHDASTADQVVSVVGAGGAALSSHAAKASLRALINISPEPISNILASLTEDGIAFSIMAVALAHPAVALVIVIAAVVACVVFVWWAWHMLRKVGRRIFARRPAST